MPTPIPPTVPPSLAQAIKRAAGPSAASIAASHLPTPPAGIRLAATAPEVYKRVVSFASIPQTPINLDRMLRAGQSLTHKKVLLSALFVHNELPIRLARRILELDSLPTKLLETDSVRKLRDEYVKSWQEAVEYPNFHYRGTIGGVDEGMRIEYELGLRPTDDFIPSLRFYHLSPDLHEITAPEEHVNKQGEFVKMLNGVKLRHRADPVFMSLGIQDYRRNLPPPLSDAAPLQSFLQSFNRGRIGTRILMGHQIAMTRDFLDGKPKGDSTRVGIIDRETDIVTVVKGAWDGAVMVAKKYYGPALTALPPVAIRTPPDTPRPTFTYIPTILHHMLFELFKNSIRATVESCSDIRPPPALEGPEQAAETVRVAAERAKSVDLKFPPIKVVIVGGREDMIIKVSDEGGGIAREHLDRMGSYMFTTAPPVHLTHDQAVHIASQVGLAPPFDDVRYSLPLAGFGYGLPITRQYAEYLGGAVEVISMEGYGTDAFLYMNRLGDVVEQLSDDVVIAGSGGGHGQSPVGEGAKAMSLY
ncbi:alpha-ketoacid dehydrogenase kinase [Gonapodya prolifera JEL478]|uniref:Protein-serine/threonine kinase n=1 Tax=Gonapodya prolifera (strain JEL478) TaxID=1344416 RepID=A0A139AZR8_GONPJ|nr:alpha-ketoacid dehydrogenase kinase [Gonapodya prolifera JEL478]|eukprot:KXS22238.1 alpha-ketoacid dehydrogenase kinase [Gonapodya prolifera JEL478]